VKGLEIGAMKFKYEHPKLVNLSGEQPAYGEDCSGGSSATTGCYNGNSAGGRCRSGIGGPCAFWRCSGGNWPEPNGDSCTNGDHAGTA
jgi:hypothetical protein